MSKLVITPKYKQIKLGSFPCENFSEISARSRRDRGRDLGAFLAAEISPRSRPRSREFLAAEISPRISAAKNAPRYYLARSRRDENLGGQKRAEITGEISARSKISAAKNAPRSTGAEISPR